MTNRLLIIPARGGSKRIRNKNIKNFFGKPIIFYSLSAGKKSGLFKKIHVSTESIKIKKLVENSGYKVDFMRPKSLSLDNVHTIDVLRFVYNKYKKMGVFFDEVWNLSCCSPLIYHTDLSKAAKLLKQNKNKVVLSITEYATPIEWSYKLMKNKILKTFYNDLHKIKLQKLEKKYHDSGSFSGFHKEHIEKKGLKIYNMYIGFKLPRSRAVDVDEPEDWKITEALYSKLKK